MALGVRHGAIVGPRRTHRQCPLKRRANVRFRGYALAAL